jgi:hypothetical protein
MRINKTGIENILLNTTIFRVSRNPRLLGTALIVGSEGGCA